MLFKKHLQIKTLKTNESSCKLQWLKRFWTLPIFPMASNSQVTGWKKPFDDCTFQNRKKGFKNVETL